MMKTFKTLSALFDHVRASSFSVTPQEVGSTLNVGPEVANSKYRSLCNIGNALAYLTPQELERIVGSCGVEVKETVPDVITSSAEAEKCFGALLRYLDVEKSMSTVNSRHMAICLTEIENALFRFKGVTRK
jgi:hypothetical protein